MTRSSWSKKGNTIAGDFSFSGFGSAFARRRRRLNAAEFAGFAEAFASSAKVRPVEEEEEGDEGEGGDWEGVGGGLRLW